MELNTVKERIISMPRIPEAEIVDKETYMRFKDQEIFDEVFAISAVLSADLCI